MQDVAVAASFEVIMAEGLSGDGTREILKRVA
jgi:hypothetical protein